MDPIADLTSRKLAVRRRIEAMMARPDWPAEDAPAILRDLGEFARLAAAEGLARKLLEARN